MNYLIFQQPIRLVNYPQVMTTGKTQRWTPSIHQRLPAFLSLLEHLSRPEQTLFPPTSMNLSLTLYL